MHSFVLGLGGTSIKALKDVWHGSVEESRKALVLADRCCKVLRRCFFFFPVDNRGEARTSETPRRCMLSTKRGNCTGIALGCIEAKLKYAN